MVTKLELATFFLILISATVSASHDIGFDLIERMEQLLDAKIHELEERHGADIDALKAESQQREAKHLKKIDELDRRVASLEKGNRALVRTIQRCRAKSWKNALTRIREDEDCFKRMTSSKTNQKSNGFLKEKLNRMLVKGHMKQTNAQIVKPKRALQSDHAIAFSTYLDHDADAIGVGQTLKFNQILLNDGNGYNKHTGVFTAPVTGVYSFTFFIAQLGHQESDAALVVNSIYMVEAVAESNNATHDAQGGNSAIVKVAAGDAVYISNIYGNHIHSDKGWRYTTFSGFLLYPTDGDTVTVG